MFEAHSLGGKFFAEYTVCVPQVVIPTIMSSMGSRQSLNTCWIILYWFGYWQHKIQDWQVSAEFSTMSYVEIGISTLSALLKCSLGQSWRPDHCQVLFGQRKWKLVFQSVSTNGQLCFSEAVCACDVCFPSQENLYRHQLLSVIYF